MQNYEWAKTHIFQFINSFSKKIPLFCILHSSASSLNSNLSLRYASGMGLENDKEKPEKYKKMENMENHRLVAKENEFGKQNRNIHHWKTKFWYVFGGLDVTHNFVNIGEILLDISMKSQKTFDIPWPTQ